MRSRSDGLAMAPRFRGHRLMMIAVGALCLAACGRDRKAGDGPYADLVAEFVPKIEQAMGLPFRQPPKLETRSRAEVAVFVRQQLESERGRSMIEGQAATYRVLGLIPDTLELLGLMQKLLEEQIVGYYDPATKVLYIVEGASKALLKQTVAHELVHALQDQYVRIDSIQKETNDADRQLAAQSVLEGHAVYMQLRIDPTAGPILKMPDGWEQIRDMIREGSGSMPVFASAPRAVREGLLFPYLGGADFVRRFLAARPEKELLTDLPVSTKQILHDSAYFGPARDFPTTVTLPAPRVGSVVFTNTFGEFETRLFLWEHLKAEAFALQGAGGLDGDRMALIRTPGGDALVWASVWDTELDAKEFLLMAGNAARRRYQQRPIVSVDSVRQQVDVPAAANTPARTVTVRRVIQNGRSVVLYMDTPADAAASIIDQSRITVAR